MDVRQAITQRRSIRHFSDRPVGREAIEHLLEAATLAPSGKNRQPWRFVVMEGAARNRLADELSRAAERLQGQGRPTGSAINTARAMREAPVTILIFNPEWTPEAEQEYYTDQWALVDTQSTGAAIQNMLLVAESLGLGTLWICDTIFASDAIAEWLGTKEQLIAAVSVGYATESPAARPRKAWPTITQWVTN